MSSTELGIDGNYLRRLRTPTAAILGIAAGLALGGCSPEAQGKEPTAAEPVHSAAPVNPGVENAENVVQQPVEATAAPAEVLMTTPDGHIVSEEEWFEEFNAVLERFRAMPLDEFSALPEEERDLFGRWTTTYNFSMMERNPLNRIPFDTQENPGLYEYNPLEASIDDSYDTALRRWLAARQGAMLVQSMGDDSSYVQDAIRSSALVFYHSKNKESGAVIHDEANNETINSARRRIEEYETYAMIPSGLKPKVIPYKHVVSEEKSDRGTFSYTNAAGETITHPAMTIVYDEIDSEGEAQERRITLVLSGDIPVWKAIGAGELPEGSLNQ